MADKDPLDDLVQKLGETYRGVKFGRGVVGKTTYATVGIIALWAAIILRLSNDHFVNLALFGGGLIPTLFYWWWVRKTHDFATKNPGLAILEGAELIEYQKWEAEVKGLPAPLKGKVIPGPRRTLLVDDPE